MTWDAARESCIFQHRSGKGGEVGCGVTDVVSVFSQGKKIHVLSVNYPAQYACIETFVDAAGVQGALFAESKDVRKLFGDDFASHSPKKIAELLVSEMR